MSSQYVAKFLTSDQRHELEGEAAAGTLQDFIEESLEDGDALCIGRSTDAWIYMAASHYLRHRDCLPDRTSADQKTIYQGCDMVDLYIPSEQIHTVLTKLQAVDFKGDDVVPFLRRSLEEWQKDGYVEELDSFPEDYREFFASFTEHVQHAANAKYSLIVYVPH